MRPSWAWPVRALGAPARTCSHPPLPLQRTACLPARPGGLHQCAARRMADRVPALSSAAGMAATPGAVPVCIMAAGEGPAAGGRVQWPRQAGHSPAAACMLARLRLSARARARRRL